MFDKLYSKVFDINGGVRLVGRQECIDLINCCKQIKADIAFGDSETGMMNVENIKQLYKKN